MWYNMEEISKEEMEELATECVAIAKKSWENNFKNYWNSGDNNREAIGRLSSIILEYMLETKYKNLGE
jgi:hypothetical protein